jgi:subtilisin family serine protease
VRRWAPPILLLASLCACSSSPVRIEPRALGSEVSESPDRFIIAAIDNDPVAFAGRAGSTPRGYDTITVYASSARARQLMRSIEGEYGLREVSAWPIEPLHMHCVVLKIPDGADRVSLLAKLSSDPRIRLAQPLQTFATRTEDYNDPYVGLQRGFKEMDVAQAHPWSQGAGVKVAIIDTGVDIGHPDLARRIAAAENFVDSDAGQFQRDRHGTEIAGVIAAVANNGEGIVGVAPAARLLVFKACWQARALVAALDAHAQVVNLSLAGPEDPLLSDLIREGLRRGILFVGAASSDAPEGKPGLLHLPGVIEVAGSENGSALATALYAPGREILTLLPGGRYDFASGDSISTAQVTGVVALLLAKNPGLSPDAAYRILRDTSSRSDVDVGDNDHVNACAAVVSLMGRGSCKASGSDHQLADKQDPRASLR